MADFSRPQVKNQKELAILLSKFRGFSSPKNSLEQWETPGEIAGIMASLAEKDISGKSVCDLGAGTGILSGACFLMGAKRVVAVEVDSDAIGTMRENFERFGISAEIVECDISEFSPEKQFDSVLMNPPFGAQKEARGLDRIFLEKAISIAPVVYSLHMASTRNFIRGFSESHLAKDSVIGTFQFPLRASRAFHTREIERKEVDFHRIWRK